MIQPKEFYRSVIEDTSWRRSYLETRLWSILHPLLSLVSVGICLLPKYGIIPFWIVFLINFMIPIQISAITHELMHEPTEKTKWNWLMRLNLHITSPLLLGFDEYKKIHLLHHLNTDRDGDPDYFMVKGSKVRSFFYLSFLNEYWFFYALFRRKTQSGFLPAYLIRLSLFFFYVYLLGFSNYLWLFFLPAKLSYGLSFLVFSHEAHTNEDGLREGPYNLQPRFPLLHQLLKLLLGPYAYHTAYDHATHHSYPWVSGRKLRLLTEKAREEGIDLPSRQFIY